MFFRRRSVPVYFGSVRFFKNMILLCVIVLIMVPSIFVFRYKAISEQERQYIELLETEAQMREFEQLSAETVAQSDFVPEHPAYQDLYPDFYAPQPLNATERTEKTIYLTFDDGPSERTDEILKILKDKDVKATFFVIGQSDEADLQRMRDIVAAGHTIGMHSYTHNYTQIYSSVEAYLEDMYQIFVQIRETTGETPTVFRFPGGSINAYNRGIYRELIAEMLRRGFVPCDWNLSGGDATGTPAPATEIIRSVVGPAADVTRGFVLMHDAQAKKTTVEALGIVIDRLTELGFTFEKLTPQTMPVLYGYQG